MQNFIKKKMNSDQVTRYLFDEHQDYINPKIIAKRQVYRLVDKVFSKVAPHLSLGEGGMNFAVSTSSLNTNVHILHTDENKENTSLHSNRSSTL